MKPSQIYGGEEECQSSESGWTMYIGSPIVDDDDGDGDGDNDSMDNIEGTTTQADPEDESDDSMASDASSGPCHYDHNQRDNSKGGYFQQAVVEEKYDDDENKYCSDKKENKTLKKQREGKMVEKEEVAFIDGKGKSPVQGGGKVLR